MRKITALAIFLLGAAVLISVPVVTEAGKTRPVVRTAIRSDTTAPLRQMPEIPLMLEVLGEIFEKPLKRLPNRAGGGGGAAPDPVAQTTQGAGALAATGDSFDGLGIINGVLPPDPAGAIGPNHYIQMTNLSFAIWLRDDIEVGKPGPVYGPFDNKTLWQGFGGRCESRNDGDPIVLYDHLADRWIMTQFALPRNGPYSECIAISQTGDPLGAWYRYQFVISENKLNDYPKFGVSPDGYYMAVNQFVCQGPFCSWGGQGVVVFDRVKMLAGDPTAQMVYFDMGLVNIDLGGMLPADWDGNMPPPPGAPNPFIEVDANEWGFLFDQLQIWNFAVDWVTPEDSTFTLLQVLETAEFDPNMCGGSRNCIPQPGGTKVDAIADRLMYRLQYRNFGGVAGSDQTLVVNHTVDVGGDRAGVRWYELNNDGSVDENGVEIGWNIAQQGTYAPADGNHRWMGSAAMNGNGDIALGYSVSSTSTHPSIRFTGRLGSDPLEDDGLMTVPEGSIVIGAGYQEHGSGRWGDYSMLTVDPRDDCTFWYTQEYYAVAGNAPWQTRIGSFQLADNCGGGGVENALPVLAANTGLAVSEGGANTIATANLEVTDADNILSELAYSVTSGPANGTLSLGAAFTQADIDNRLLSYQHDGGDTLSDSFDFTVSDGAGGGIGTTTFDITVTPVGGGGTASVTLDCQLYGGRFKDTHLDNIIIVTDSQGNPVQNASVAVTILFPDLTTNWGTGGSTASDGTVTFSVKGADAGDYVMTVDIVVVAAPLVWDDAQPPDPTCTKP